jgi:hypothetical protein
VEKKKKPNEKCEKQFSRAGVNDERRTRRRRRRRRHGERGTDVDARNHGTTNNTTIGPNVGNTNRHHHHRRGDGTRRPGDDTSADDALASAKSIKTIEHRTRNRVVRRIVRALTRAAGDALRAADLRGRARGAECGDAARIECVAERNSCRASTVVGELDATLAEWSDDSSRIGPHFIKFAPYFKLYNEYCANYNSFMSKINAKLAKADHPLSLFVDKIANELRAEANLRLDLASFLIMPVQRLPRYRLLLTELVDATAKPTTPTTPRSPTRSVASPPSRSRSTPALPRAPIATSSSRSRTSLRVTRGAPPAIVEPQRTFIREGELRKLCRKGVKRRRVWLFSDSLLYATPSDVPGTRISIKPALLSLRGASVAEVPANSLAIDDVTPYALQISTPTKSFIAYCESTDERNGWLEALIGVILKLGGSGAPTLPWTRPSGCPTTSRTTAWSATRRSPGTAAATTAFANRTTRF